MTSANNYTISKLWEKIEKKLEERRKHTGVTSEDFEVEVDVVDVNLENRSSMNHESAAMSEGFKNDSSDNYIFYEIDVHFLLLTLIYFKLN